MRRLTNILFAFTATVLLLSCVSKNLYKGYDSKRINELSKIYGVRLTESNNVALYDAGSEWLGVKHRDGGSSKKGVDCSGLTQILYKKVYGIKLERSSANILQQNCKPISKEKLREGDLVFFNTLNSKKSKHPTHVGIYLKNGKFIHSTTSKGVIISNLSEPYYIRTWNTGGRVHN